MIEGIKVFNLNKRFQIHLVKSKKFKTDLIGLYILRPLNEDEASKNALITRIINRGTKAYPTTIDFNNRLDELYGAVFSSDVLKYGEKLAIQVKLQFPNKRLIDNQTIFDESLGFLKEVIENTNSDGFKFNEAYFEQEREKLIDEIKGRINDKVSYAVERCVEEMCIGEPYAIYQYGSEESALNLKNEEVYEHYKSLVDTSPIQLIVIGDIDFDETIGSISRHFDYKEGDTVKIPKEIPIHKKHEVIEIEEVMNVNQGKLTLGFRTQIDFQDPLYEASVVYSTLLGGGTHSFLFKNVREKASLCYYIFSKLEKFKSMMLVTSGIESDKRDLVVEMIKDNIKSIENGDFTDEDLNIAKKTIISSVKSMADYQNSFINFYYSRDISGVPFDEKLIIEEVEAVTKEQVIEAAKRIELDTIHFIRGEINESH